MGDLLSIWFGMRGGRGAERPRRHHVGNRPLSAGQNWRGHRRTNAIGAWHDRIEPTLVAIGNGLPAALALAPRECQTRAQRKHSAWIVKLRAPDLAFAVNAWTCGT
ncbi:MAG TPA: hypothetical protein VNZ26_28640, partial [Vicinamibacterales bacterium]|nr:hypothetical protein [Vicinamibacterales bacterium]